MLIRYWMTMNVVTIDKDASIQDAVRLLRKNNIRHLPVMKRGKLEGIITESDIFEVLVSMTGVRQGGIQFAFYIIDKPDFVREILYILRSYGGRMVSILNSYQRAEEGRCYV
ncbi:MAG: CBS domain-containing protein [Thermodesulfobacteriota bacterium]|nr:CBS domain-containing protein [Thermodesulfobacteriota bacterium]